MIGLEKWSVVGRAMAATDRDHNVLQALMPIRVESNMSSTRTTGGSHEGVVSMSS